MKTSSPHWFRSSLVALTEDECREILRVNQVGRIVFDDARGPVALPVNYTVDGGDVVVRTTPTGAIARNTAHQRVAFEVDEIDDFNESGCSVVVRGTAIPTTPLDKPTADALPYPWAEGPRHQVIRIRPDTITGRRLITF